MDAANVSPPTTACRAERTVRLGRLLRAPGVAADQRALDGLRGLAATFSLRADPGLAVAPTAAFGWSAALRSRRFTSGAFLSAYGLLETLN